jgi:hypothetical protein
MTKLTDKQLVVLSAASQRGDRLIVLPNNSKGGAAKALVTKLIEHGLVREVRVKQDQPHWTMNDTGHPIGLKITKAGLTAIAVEPDATNAEPTQDTTAVSTGSAKRKPSTEAGEPRPGTKQALVISMLEREQGATLSDLVKATSWLPHTTRAALTGLRKKGFNVGKTRSEDGTTVYRLSSDTNAGASVKR